MKITRAQKTKAGIRVAIQGEAGSFSQEAARRLLPGGQIVACARSAEVFQAAARVDRWAPPSYQSRIRLRDR